MSALEAGEITGIAKQVIAELEDFDKRVRAQFVGTAPGNVEAQGPIFVQWFMQKCGVGVTPEMLATPGPDGLPQFFPPEPMITPDGQEVMLSPWLLALPFLEDGAGLKDLRKFERLTGTDMRWVERLAGKPIRRMGPYERVMKAQEGMVA